MTIRDDWLCTKGERQDVSPPILGRGEIEMAWDRATDAAPLAFESSPWEKIAESLNGGTACRNSVQCDLWARGALDKLN
jgi:hypothetical protein